MFQDLGISPFDIAVIGIVVIGGLIGLITGFVRGGLFIASWFASIFVTLHGLPRVQPYARQYISDDWIGDLIGAAGLFLVALIVFHIISHIISAWVRGSRLNALDRSLGLLAGFTGAAVIISGVYLTVIAPMPPADQPPWVRDARTRPMVEVAALFVRDFVPAEIQQRLGLAELRARESVNQLEQTRRAFEQLTQPPATRAPDRQPGYDARQRNDLERLIEGSQ